MGLSGCRARRGIVSSGMQLCAVCFLCFFGSTGDGSQSCDANVGVLWRWDWQNEGGMRRSVRNGADCRFLYRKHGAGRSGSKRCKLSVGAGSGAGAAGRAWHDLMQRIAWSDGSGWRSDAGSADRAILCIASL